MDNKTIFIKTRKGEDEMQGRTTHLPGDIKRALLMVDGDLTFAEISKRAAPSLRSSIDQLFQELVKGGYIQDKSQAQSQARSGNIPRMSVPVKMATPQKNKAANNVGELDFMGGFPLEPSDVPVAGPAKAAMLKAEAKENIEREVEAAQYSAQHEAEGILFQAEQDKAGQEREAARLKAEQEARARQENAEKARRETERLKEEQEALQVRIKLDAARQRAEQEARSRVDATAQAQASKDAEAARVREEAQRIVRLAQEAREREEQALKAARVREEAERAIRLEREAKEREEQERRVREEAERIVRLEREAREREEQERRVREEAERIVRLEREAKEREEQERRLREEAERIVRLEREAKELEEQARKAREEAERIVRLEGEEQARKAREEAERIARLEQEARELEEQERKAALVREEVQRLLRQEQQERETKSPEPAMPDSGPASGEWGLFSFDSFQVDEPLYTSESHMEKNPAKKDAQPAQPARPAAASPAGKSGTFAFDAFQVDEPPLPVEKSGSGQSAATAKTVPPAQVGGQQPPAAGKAGKGKPDQEQARRAKQEQQRKAEEMKQAKQISEAQARVWAEAEQRALETARAEVEQAGKHAAITVAEVSAARPALVARARRKQFSWGKLAGFVFRLGLVLLVLIAGALFVIPYVVSTREYLPRAEQLLSTKLHQPVHVGSLSGRILPTPRLELGEIYIGDAKQLQVKVAQINFSFTGLFTDVKPVNSIEFEDIKVRGAWLTDASGWMQKLAGDDRYPVSRMLISNGTLDADVFELAGIEGELNFDPYGKFTRGDLRANGGKYDLGITTDPANKLDIALTVRNSALPLLPNWTFDTLTAKGDLNNGELVIGNFDAQMFGGALQGNADLNWRSGWIVQGTLSAKRINMQKLSKLLDGNADGSARFKMASAYLGKLADSATLDGNFNSSDGTISGVEIADTARKLSRENLPGGRTHYDGLTGNFSFENGVYHFKQAKIIASGLTALATFDADTAKQQVSGKIGVTLSLPARAAPVELMLGGAIDSPTLVYAP
jgi:hypothetical protein